MIRSLYMGKTLNKTMNDMSGQVGYDIIHCNNDDIKPVNSLESDSQKL